MVINHDHYIMIIDYDYYEPHDHKIMTISWLIKVVSEFPYRLRIFLPEYENFWQNGYKKWHFGCPNENSKTTFISQTSPKNDEIAFRFKRLPLLDRISANF